MGVRVFIIGLSGSGKTTLARQVGARYGADVYELDWIVWEKGDRSGLLPLEERTAHAEKISAGESWVVEGVYFGSWTRPLMEHADLIVWLDVPLRVALWRIFWRHVKAELRGDNRFPGWRKLFRFMRLVRKQYRGSATPLSEDDPPLSRNNIAHSLVSYSNKVVQGREATFDQVIKRLESQLKDRSEMDSPFLHSQ